MKLTSIIAASVAATLALGSSALASTQLTVTSYDAPNGDGAADCNCYNYWDKHYGGGTHTTSGEALTGGTGDLTDGFATTQTWNQVEVDYSGEGPYVGWWTGKTPNPLITFHFAGAPTVDSISIWLDNSNYGGVSAPNAILIDGVSRAFTAPASGTAGVVAFSGLNLLATGAHTIQFQQQPGSWAFVNEVRFFGTTVPEPGAWSLMILGIGAMGVALRRRRLAEA